MTARRLASLCAAAAMLAGAGMWAAPAAQARSRLPGAAGTASSAVFRLSDRRIDEASGIALDSEGAASAVYAVALPAALGGPPGSPRAPARSARAPGVLAAGSSTPPSPTSPNNSAGNRAVGALAVFVVLGGSWMASLAWRRRRQAQRRRTRYGADEEDVGRPPSEG